jgi:protocatechuate 4,5-dioxygenase alpha chain
MDERDGGAPAGPPLLHGHKARAGYALNSMCMSLNEAEGREQFRRDPEAYMERFGLSEAQRRAVRARDWRGMSDLGANVYFLIKLAIVDGVSVPELGARISGTDSAEFQAMMASGGRAPRG